MTRTSLVSLLAIPAFLVAVASTPSMAATSAHQATQAPVVKSTTPAAHVAKPAPTAAVKPAELLNINTATKEQLEALPGIGVAYSQKIIDGRPYNAKSDLKARKIIPASEYSKISKLIIAKQPTKPPAK